MIIRVSELDEQGLRIDDVAALAQGLSDPSWRLEAASLEVEAEGSDVFVRGRVGGRRAPDLRPLRSGRPAPSGRRPWMPRLIPRPVEGDSVELGVDDLDLDFYHNDQLDLDPHRGDGDQPGAADEAAVPQRLPRSVSGVRGSTATLCRVRARRGRPTRVWRSCCDLATRLSN